MTELVAVPCWNCGGELYDSVRRYHIFEGECTSNPCYNHDHFTEGGYCPHCTLQTVLDPDVAEAERKLLFEPERLDKGAIMLTDEEMRLSILREFEEEWAREDMETPPSKGVTIPPIDIFAPQSFDDYVGQNDAKSLAQIMIQAAKKENRPLPNMLIVGEYGLGKTSLARLIMQDYGEPVRLVDGSSVNAALPSDHVIIDEIHNMNPEVADSLNILIDSNKVHIIGCTTDPGALPSAFRSRFRTLQLESYDVQNLTEIISRVVRRKNVSATGKVLSEIAARSRFNARHALNNLALVFDLLTISNQSVITSSVVKDAFKRLGVDSQGYLRRDYKFMAALSDRPVGLQYLQAMTGLDSKTIEEEVEPYLMKMGLLDRTPRGRLKLKELVEE